MNWKQQQLHKAERAWYRAKARAEQAVDRLSDCERKVARLREDLIYTEARGNTGLDTRRCKQMAKKLKGILIEVNGGVVSLCPVQRQARNDLSPFRLGRAPR